MDASRTYRQLGKCRLVMCEKPKRMEAIISPAAWLLLARDKRFCSSPRKRNSSGHAVKKKIPIESGTNDFQSLEPGAYKIKRIRMPSGMAMHANAASEPSTSSVQPLPQPRW